MDKQKQLPSRGNIRSMTAEPGKSLGHFRSCRKIDKAVVHV